MKNNIVAFGEILLRLSPVDMGLLSNSSQFDASFGGTESNVLVTLSGFGHECKYISVVPKNSFGVGVEQHLHKYGVDTSFMLKKGEILGTYYLEQGFGSRSSSVIYNRKHSEITHIDKNLFSPEEYDKIFENCELFHISGISFGLSEGCKELSYRMIEEAHSRGISVSFDCNYRAKVWGEYPSSEYEKILNMADIIFCSQKDLDAIGIKNIEDFLISSRCKYLIMREKTNIDFETISAECRIFERKGENIKKYISAPVTFNALEKIGGGDAFDAGILHYLLKDDCKLDEAMRFALGCYELKHTVIGDILWTTEEQIADLLKNKANDKGLIR